MYNKYPMHHIQLNYRFPERLHLCHIVTICDITVQAHGNYDVTVTELLHCDISMTLGGAPHYIEVLLGIKRWIKSVAGCIEVRAPSSKSNYNINFHFDI